MKGSDMFKPSLLWGAFARFDFAAVIVLALVFVTTESSSAHADACATTLVRARELSRMVVAENPSAEVTEYSGVDAKKLLVAINATPPVTDLEADTILIIDPKDDLPFRVALSVSGCVRGASRVERGTWADVLKAAFGDRS
jgi:hypothetical protein